MVVSSHSHKNKIFHKLTQHTHFIPMHSVAIASYASTTACMSQAHPMLLASVYLLVQH